MIMLYVDCFGEAKQIAQSTGAEEKFPFYLDYEADQKDHLQFMLQMVGAIVEDDDEENNAVSVQMNMTQLALELSFIRSVYKMLKHEPQGGVKACYAISALLSLFSIVLMSLILAKAVSFSFLNQYQDPTAEILILAGWPVFLVSFILGSLPVERVSIDTTPSKDVF